MHHPMQPALGWYVGRDEGPGIQPVRSIAGRNEANNWHNVY